MESSQIQPNPATSRATPTETQSASNKNDMNSPVIADNLHIVKPYIDPDNDVSIFTSYRSLYLSTYIDVGDSNVNPIVAVPINLWNSFKFSALGDKSAKVLFHRLENANGYLAPGESTLILGQPGSGRSTLLKLLGQQLTASKGDILFNGLSRNELEKEQKLVDVRKLVSYVDQLDNHFPGLTVWETLQFAHTLSTPNPSHDYCELLLSQFGLEECRNTPLHSCSGGQKRRVSLLVGLANQSQQMSIMEQYSDGLDSAVTERITDFMTKWSTQNNTHFVATLQQPSPAVFNMFTNIILLHEGKTVYSGPTKDVLIFFQGMGFTCPLDVDVPTFLLHIITHPKVFLQEQALLEGTLTKVQTEIEPSEAITADFADINARASRATTSGRASIIRIDPSKRKTLQTSFGPLTPSIYPLTEIDDMCNYYITSPFYKHIQRVLNHMEEIRRDKLRVEETKMIKDRTEFLKAHSSVQNNGNCDDHFTPSHELHEGHTTDILSNDLIKSLSLHPATPKDQNPVITPATHKRYSPGYNISVFQLLSTVLYRQLVLTMRNKVILISRVIPCLFIAFLFGGLYFQLGTDQYHYRVASYIDCLTEIAYFNLIELGLFIHSRQLIHSQLHLYPTWTYTISVFISNIPYSLVEALLFTVIPYAMIGHAPYGVSIVTYYLLIWIHGLVFSTLFRFLASLSTNVVFAYALTTPIISVFSLCSGFYVRLDTLPYYFWWIFYISPFTYGLRSMASNEFASPRYDDLLPLPSDPAVLARVGDIYLEFNGMPSGGGWILWAAFFCIGVIFTLTLLTSYFLYAPEIEYSIGTRRFAGQEDDDVITFDVQDEQKHLIEQGQDEIELAQHQLQQQLQQVEAQQLDNTIPLKSDSSVANYSLSPLQTTNSTQQGVEMSTFPSRSEHSTEATYEASITGREPSRSRFAAGNRRLATLTDELPFTPASLTFENIKFTVRALGDDQKTFDRVLLQNVTGFARSGTSTCLMGSSGAGKTTLLNTLFGINKTTATQTVEGRILVNGKECSQHEFASIVGYCEQFDTLHPFETVYETLFFSAKMRLGDVSDDIAHRVVEEVIEVLELTKAKDLLIGSPTMPILSPSQKKRVSIGIELVANPSILFLDEPSTGLDSESALAVIRTINKIARSGRCVICTIHQPSAQLLYMFDSLLLLGSGGYTIFFGRLGRRATNMIRYFNNMPSVSPCPRRINPSEWLIEQVSRPISNSVLKEAQELHDNYWSGKLEQKPAHFDSSNPPPYPPFDQLSSSSQFIRFLSVRYLTSDLRNRGMETFSLLTNASLSGGKANIDTSNNGTLNTTTSSIGSTEAGSLAESTKLPFFRQFVFVLTRCWHVYQREASLFYTRFISTLLLSCFFALFYAGLQINSASSALTFLSATIFCICKTTYTVAATALPVYNELRPIFYRETFAHYYKAIFWPLSFTLCEIVWLLPITVTCFLPQYFAIGAIETDALVFFSYWLVIYILCFFYTQLTLMLSLAFPSHISQIFQNFYVAICFSLGNIAMNYPNINKGFQVIMLIFPFYHVNQAITTEQVKYKGEDMINVFLNQVPETISVKDHLLNLTGYTGTHQYGWGVLWLFVMIGAFWIVGYNGAIFVRWKH